VGSFPVAEKQAKYILSLPIYPELQPMELEWVVQIIHEFYSA
jgi:dTDP-4-amino-4,6-dideoxygalactose transaminase